VRTRSLALFAIVVVALLIAAGGVYAYDSSRGTKIARGVTVDGIPVGGLDTAAARAKLRAALAAPLDRPVRVRYRDRRFSLGPRRAQIAVDVDAAVRQALVASRDGNVLTRTLRGLTGREVRRDVRASVSYSKPALAALLRRVRRAVDRAPVDAALDLEHGNMTPTPARAGRRVLVSRLEREVRGALLSRAPQRAAVRVHTRTLKPAVTRADLEKKYPTMILVDRGAFRLTLYKHLDPVATYPIAVGQAGLETPAGLYSIQNKAVNPAWHVPTSDWAGDLAGKVIPGDDPSNPIKARWMGIYDGAGIHGTSEDSSIGSAASHGCIRMHIPDVEALYDRVPVGAPVYIK
jgi:lipoprotein-anchoring transpeptidase ErfK/SrfK